MTKWITKPPRLSHGDYGAETVTTLLERARIPVSMKNDHYICKAFFLVCLDSPVHYWKSIPACILFADFPGIPIRVAIKTSTILPHPHHFTTPRTARYYTSADAAGKYRHVWYLLHGHGQSGRHVLSKLSPALPEDVLAIAPEALNHYYLDGYNGRVGPTWMTSEDRENEIRDYVTYLDGLHRHLQQQWEGQPQVHVLGFSQGASTAARWAALGEVEAQTLVLWGGKLPRDIPQERLHKRLRRLHLHYILGNNDRWISPEVVQAEHEFLAENQLQAGELLYEGKHELVPEVWQQFLQENGLAGDVEA